VTAEIGIVYGVLVGAIVLFVSDRLRLDVVAVLALLALVLAGVLPPEDALAGFAEPVVVMIAALFIVGEGLFQTGVARSMGRLPARLAGDSEVRLLVVLMLLVAFLSAFMSSTGTVAVMLPVAMGLAWDRGIAPSRLLIPLSVASLLGGMLTLIGTAPNIVVSNQLRAAGREPFRFLDFTPVGLVMVAVGVAFMALVGRRLLPDRKAPAPEGGFAGELATREVLLQRYGLGASRFVYRVPPGSALAGRTLREADVRKAWGVTVLDIARAAEAGRRRRRPAAGPVASVPVLPDTRLEAGDRIEVLGRPESVEAMAVALGLEPGSGVAGLLPPHVGLAEVLLTPRSRLIGHTLRELRFREKHRLTVLGLRRLGERKDGAPDAETLRFGDTLLVKGPWRRIRLLQEERRDFVVVARPADADAAEPQPRAPLAVAIAIGMMALLTTGVVAPVVAVLLAALAMVMTGCVAGEDAYRSISWESVVLIAAILPLATALDRTGGLDLMVDGLDAVLGGAGPLLLMGVLFVLTSAMSQVISNTATTVLLAPVALEAALRAGVAPEPFLMAIAVAASTAFATPIASPVNTLVLGPGGYRFGDFFRIGIALQVLILAATLLVVPLLFPF
jgi:di/tricarboxylate transporter